MSASSCIDGFPEGVFGVVDFFWPLLFLQFYLNVVFKFAQSALRKLMDFSLVLSLGWGHQLMDRTIGNWSKPNAYSVRQLMFNAMLEVAGLMSVELLQEQFTLVLSFFLSST